MRRIIRFLFPLLLLGLVTYCHAQLWSGILSPSRAVDWSSAGVSGGVPSASWAQCGSTVAAYSGTAGTINNAVAACGANTFVLLGSGTFKLSSGITMKPGVVLRGAGADQTSLVFSGDTACGGMGGNICFIDSAGWYYGSSSVQPGGTNAATWTAGYTQGATSITLSNVGSSGIVNGQYIYLDQANDTSVSSAGLMVCDETSPACSLEGGSPGRTVGGHHRNQIQIVKVVGGCSTTCKGAGPFTVTITPGLYGVNWSSGKAPGAWWSANDMQNSGVEELTIDNSSSSATSGIYFNNAFNCWASGVRSLNGNRNHVWLWQSAHITVQNSYFYGTQNAAAQSYGVESFISSDNLAVNNVFQKVTSPFMMGPSHGSVFAYNFSINNYYYVSGWMMPWYIGHDAGVLYNLFEGNVGEGVMSDVFHGTGGLNTVFRNRLTGWEAGKTEDTAPVQFYSYQRYQSIIGNILGTSGYHNTYQTSLGAGQSTSIYDLNAGNKEGSVTVASDSYVSASLMRWGNYDVVNGANRFVSAEVPSGLKDGYANSVPSGQSLPSSFYYSESPSWWPSGKAWPPIGPDVTGGNIGQCSGGTYNRSQALTTAQCSGGSLGSAGINNEAHSNPAMDCYFNVMSGTPDGSGNALSFNAGNCYTSGLGGGGGPQAPTGLTATVH